MTLHLFKEVYLELADTFQFHDTNENDCIMLSEQYDAILPPGKTRLVYKYADLDMLVADKFGGYIQEFFKALFNYPGKKKLVVFCNEADFTRLALQYYKDLYPGITDRTLLSLFDILGSRIFLKSTSWAQTGEAARKVYREFGSDRDSLHLAIQNTKPKLTYTDEMKLHLPFHALYANFLLAGEASSYHPLLLKHVREYVIYEFRNLMLTISDNILAMTPNLNHYFPEVRKHYHLADTLSDPKFTLIFDKKGVSSNSRTWLDEAPDVNHVLTAYAPEYFDYLLEKCVQLTDISPLVPQSNISMLTSWSVLSDVLRTGNFHGLLVDPKINLPGAMSIHHTYRSKYHWFFIRYVEGLIARNDAESKHFAL